MMNYTPTDHDRDERARRDVRLCDTLFSEAEKEKGRWRKIAELTFPELLQASDLHENDGMGCKPPVCHRARQGIYKLASAHMTFITPMGDKWFQFESWDSQASPDEGWVDKFDWFYQTTEIAQKELERSNFYTELIGVYIDRSVTGTGLLLSEEVSDGGLVFTHIPAGTYGLAENNMHEVDTVARKFNMTPAQIMDEFGDGELPESIRALFDDEQKRYTEQRKIYHLVEPRRDYVNAEDLPSERLPYRSVYIDAESGHVLQESGYWEFPYIATRFVRYGNKVYGDSALAGLEKVMMDLNAIHEAIKITAERKAIPSILISAGLAEQVDLRSGGKTIISQQDAALSVPREWAASGDQREMIEYARLLEERIDDATFVSILQTISSVDRQMTAREVAARESEKIMTFTQSFTQNAADFKPLMNRIFAMLFRLEKVDMDDVPDGLAEFFVDSYGVRTGIRRVLPPKVTYIGRMAQSLQYAQMSGLSNTLYELVDLAAQTKNSEFLMPVNAAMVARYKLNASGAPYVCTNSPDKVRKMQQQANDAAVAQQQAEMAEMDSAAARNYAQATQTRR